MTIDRSGDGGGVFFYVVFFFCLSCSALFCRCAWNSLIAHVSIRIEIDQSVRFFFPRCCCFHSAADNLRFQAQDRFHDSTTITLHGTQKHTRGAHTTGADLFNWIELKWQRYQLQATAPISIYDVVVTTRTNPSQTDRLVVLIGFFVCFVHF